MSGEARTEAHAIETHETEALD